MQQYGTTERRNGISFGEGYLGRALTPDPSIRERGTLVASAQANAPNFIMGAGFGETTLASVCEGKMKLIICENFARFS